MKIGKMDFKNWTWGRYKLVHPLLLLWRLPWALPVYGTVLLLCVLYGISLGPQKGRDLYHHILDW